MAFESDAINISILPKEILTKSSFKISRESNNLNAQTLTPKTTNQAPSRKIFDLLESKGAQICEEIENCSKKWHHRTFNTLRLALLINDHANNKVNHEQLTAATLAHGFAMAFLLGEIINKKSKLDYPIPSRTCRWKRLPKRSK